MNLPNPAATRCAAALLGLLAGGSAAWGVSPLAAEPAFGAQPAPAGEGADALQLRVLHNPQGPPTMAVLDPVRQVLAVYQVDPTSGQISLRSVRLVRFDLRLDDFQTNKPSPADLREAQD